jgi:hypothetical protein
VEDGEIGEDRNAKSKRGKGLGDNPMQGISTSLGTNGRPSRTDFDKLYL